MTLTVILASILSLCAFFVGVVIGRCMPTFGAPDDGNDDEDEETGSPYRRNCIPADPERQFDKDGGRPKPVPSKKSLSDEINGVEILALQNAVERLKRSAIEHANGGWMNLYQDDMENLRKYQKRLEKLV